MKTNNNINKILKSKKSIYNSSRLVFYSILFLISVPIPYITNTLINSHISKSLYWDGAEMGILIWSIPQLLPFLLVPIINYLLVSAYEHKNEINSNTKSKKLLKFYFIFLFIGFFVLFFIMNSIVDPIIHKQSIKECFKINDINTKTKCVLKRSSNLNDCLLIPQDIEVKSPVIFDLTNNQNSKLRSGFISIKKDYYSKITSGDKYEQKNKLISLKDLCIWNNASNDQYVFDRAERAKNCSFISSYDELRDVCISDQATSIEDCNSIKTPQLKNLCFSDLAIYLQNKKICSSISKNNINDRDSCLSGLAFTLNDKEICSLVSKNNTIEKDACFHNLAYVSNNKQTCTLISDKNIAYKDNCFYILSYHSKDEKLCTLISDENIANRDNCFSRIAINLQDTNPCSLISQENIKEKKYCTRLGK